MKRRISDFLRDEDHASKVLIGGSVVVMAICLAVAIAAISFMR